MIFKRASIPALLAGEITATSRAPAHRYKLGRVYPVQPGRYQKHVAHVRIVGLYEATVRDLKAEGWWGFPDDIAPDDLQGVIEFELAPRCDACLPYEGGGDNA